jgi:peptidyl-prolyl cis-trans isomerase D
VGGVSKAIGIPELADFPKIMDEAFQLRTGQVSRFVRSGDRYAVLKLVEKVKERQPSLEEVHSTVEKDFLKDQAQAAAIKKAEDVIAALKQQPGDPDKVAADFGLTWTKMDPVSRTSEFVSQLGKTPEVSEMLTSISASAPLFPRPISTPQGVAVVRLSDVQRADDKQYEKEEEPFQKWVLGVRQTDIRKGWIRLLEDRSQVSISEKL